MGYVPPLWPAPTILQVCPTTPKKRAPMSDGGGLRRRGAARDADGGAPRASRKKFTLETMDLYAKVEEEDRVKTSTGASLSLVSLVVICLLVLSELRSWLSLVRSEHWS